ncbi:MAG: Sua5/YciO/YrdC/YwlC family protein [Mariprofundales bacterium]|nr:Sua5/YciO/YrdC/YwlC family protein [Mariprofundales bacterium]
MARRFAPLLAARALRSGWLIAHQSDTLPGIAALANDPTSLRRLTQFKQRQAPFLLLISHRSILRRLCIRLNPMMRQTIRRHWPGAVTLIFPASSRTPTGCRYRGGVAVRWIDDPATQRMVAAAGGAVLSSSLNRKGESPRAPCWKMRYRWHRYHIAPFSDEGIHRAASTLIDLRGNSPKRLR